MEHQQKKHKHKIVVLNVIFLFNTYIAHCSQTSSYTLSIDHKVINPYNNILNDGKIDNTL